MTLRELRVGWRTLVKEPGYSLVVVLGLAVGFAVCLLLLGFVRYSWQYDAQVPDADHIYVAKIRFNVDSSSPWFEQAPSMLRAVALHAPGVADATGIVRWGDLSVRIDDKLIQLPGNPVLPHFAAVLGVKAIAGDIDAALSQPDSIAITEDAAQRLFGSAQALDRTAKIDGKTIRIAAILNNHPTNTIMPYQVLFGTQSVLIDNKQRPELNNGSNWIKILIHVHPDGSIAAITDLLQRALDASPDAQQITPEIRQRLGTRKVMDIALSPLRDAYFDHDVAANPIDKPGDRADKIVVTGLGAIALLILVLAAINYVNLATVRALQRQREIGIRKTLGAGTWQIVRQFGIESLLVTLIAVSMGLALARLALPLFSELMHRQLGSIFSLDNMTFALALAIALGVICAIYPAWIAIKVKPAQTLAGRQNTESTHGMHLRQALTVVQLAGAMGLAGVALAVAWQTQFALRADPGFDPSPLLIVDLPVQVRESEKAQGFVETLSHQPGVAGIANSFDAVGRFDNVWGQDVKREGGSATFLEFKSVSANFFQQYRIKPMMGRLFDPAIDKENDPAPFVINEVAARQLGFATAQAALGQIILDSKMQAKRIVGIAPEVRFYSLHDKPRAIGYELFTGGTTVSVRVTGSTVEVERVIRQLWPSYFPDAMPQIRRAGDILSANYDADGRLARLLSISAAVILSIAAFGAYALSARTIQRRAREIVLRKLHGASIGDIGLLVGREMGRMILIAAVMGLPLAAIAIDRYLSNYVEHAPMGYWMLLLAVTTVCATTTLAAARHTWMASSIHPVEALRL